MASYSLSYEFAYPPTTLLDVLANVEAHKHFIPLCKESTLQSTSKGPDGIEISVAHYRFCSKKFGVDHSAIQTLTIDRDKREISYETVSEGEKQLSASSHVRLEALPNNSTRIHFNLTYEAGGILAIFLPKRTLSGIAFDKVAKATDNWVGKLHTQSSKPQSQRDVSSLPDNKTDARANVLALFPKNSIGAELGVHMGAFAEQILTTVSPRKLYLVDPWKALNGSEYSESWYAEKDQNYMDELHQLVSERFASFTQTGVVEVRRAMSWDFLDSLQDSTLDWIYIDADHRYEAVRRDLESSYKKVKIGGLIAGDDHQVAGWWRDNIVRAVDEFVASYPVEPVLVDGDQFALRKL